jgi:hypothetical protein
MAAFVLFQLIAPLTYYLRDDPYDERFAWRMFSAVRLYRCQTRAYDVLEDEDGRERVRPVHLMSFVHVAWVTTLRRNRRDVVLAFLERRCEESDASRARLVNHCVGTDGRRLDPLVYERDCDSGEVTEPSASELPSRPGDAS